MQKLIVVIVVILTTIGIAQFHNQREKAKLVLFDIPGVIVCHEWRMAAFRDEVRTWLEEHLVGAAPRSGEVVRRDRRHEHVVLGRVREHDHGIRPGLQEKLPGNAFLIGVRGRPPLRMPCSVADI